MISVNCYDLQGERLTAYTQWDRNQEIVFEGQFDSPPIIHYYNKTMTSAYSVPSEVYDAENELYKVPVPNALFLVPYNVFMYFFIEDGDKGRSVYFKNIPVRPKAKPNDFEFEENIHIISLVQLEKELRELIQSSTASEEERKANEETRKQNEAIRQTTLEETKQTIQDAQIATEKANEAAEKALIAAAGDISNKTVQFQTAGSVGLLESGDTLGIMIGQVNKWLVDLSDEITQEEIKTLFAQQEEIQ